MLDGVRGQCYVIKLLIPAGIAVISAPPYRLTVHNDEGQIRQALG